MLGKVDHPERVFTTLTISPIPNDTCEMSKYKGSPKGDAYRTERPRLLVARKENRLLDLRSPPVRRFKRLIRLPDVTVEVSLSNCCKEMPLLGICPDAKVGPTCGKALSRKGLKD